MIDKKTKKIGVFYILMALLFIGLNILDNYLTPKLGSCYDNRNRIPHSHTGPCNHGDPWWF